ncbi:hypothetical protein [Streptomyces sp. NPDC002467]|uniref:hypothetical protein n=1 Tax=Streptomyces sp. NPDC002467 TaxID=3364647 RepID=UPI0036CFF39B
MVTTPTSIALSVCPASRLYFCEHYPTVEVHFYDVQLEADRAVMLAGAFRGLATTPIAKQQAGFA